MTIISSSTSSSSYTRVACLWLIFSSLSSCAKCQGKVLMEEERERSAHHHLGHRFQIQRIIFSIFLGILTGLAFSFLFAFLVRWFVRYINRTPILRGSVVFSPKIPPNTLRSALAAAAAAANETQLLGSSPNGAYFKAVLENGPTVAVKRLEPFEPSSPEAQRKIQRELEVLASLRHRNLMSLRAYVREFDRLCLVYDYVPTGSLEDAMRKVRDNQLQLSWEIRHRIALGVVTGLRHLHFSCGGGTTTRVLHYDLKPANVMLDADFEPRLADCGLARIIPNFNRAASGYSAPESFQNCRYTDKSDIFSFGVILGVLLSGRNPADPFFGEAAGNGGSLGQWIRRLQQAGEAREALDKSMVVGVEEEEMEMLMMALRIALVCLSDLPADRPSSDELVSMLTQLNSF